ncbi:MAG: LON peptidase substrate-binding domain-containing protein, partial [Thermodesulfobacteriota bacterium]|nr:LON peptidase substrate-binding domain-containing protein [Thermodesulfobacteriota bacterium]
MTNLQNIFKDDEPVTSKLILPMLPLRDIVVFPHMVAPLFVGRAKSVQGLSDAMNRDKKVFLATQKKMNIENPRPQDISSIGTIGDVLQLLRLPDGTVKALVEGETRARIVRFVKNEDLFLVEIEPVVEPEISTPESVALSRAIVQNFEEYVRINKNISKSLVTNAASISDPSQLADTVATHFSFKMKDKQRLLETTSPSKRLSLLLGLIKMEIDIFRMDQKIKKRVKKQMEKTQKSYYLNEQMRAIKKEMGADEGVVDDLQDL